MPPTSVIVARRRRAARRAATRIVRIGGPSIGSTSACSAPGCSSAPSSAPAPPSCWRPQSGIGDPNSDSPTGALRPPSRD